MDADSGSYRDDTTKQEAEQSEHTEVSEVEQVKDWSVFVSYFINSYLICSFLIHISEGPCFVSFHLSLKSDVSVLVS